jgi:hypothetical protein
MSDVPLEYLNHSELMQILASDDYGNLRLKASVPKERLVHLIRARENPTEDEIALTAGTRHKLQLWIIRYFDQVGSQIPCSGPLRGQCTRYPCSEGRHLDCYLSAKKYMV